MDPSTTKMKFSMFPSAARWKAFIKSLPLARARKGLCRVTFGIQGICPRRISSILGWVAAVMAMVSPSQPRPAVIHSTSSSVTPPWFVAAFVIPCSVDDIISVQFQNRKSLYDPVVGLPALTPWEGRMSNRYGERKQSRCTVLSAEGSPYHKLRIGIVGHFGL